MRNIQAICGLLAEKLSAFECYEAETRAMLVCGVDEIEAHMEARQKLADQITALDRRVEEQIADSGGPAARLREAVRNACPRDSLPEALWPLYDSARPVFAVTHRVQRVEAQVRERVETERNDLLEKIKKHNTSGDAQAVRYYGSVGQTGGSLLGNGSRQA